jgi:hypothetical protein
VFLGLVLLEQFINDILGEETYFEFLNENPIIKPNYFILALLRRVYNGISQNNIYFMENIFNFRRIYSRIL